MIDDPPVFVGAFQVTVIEGVGGVPDALPVATTCVGAPGTVAGVADREGADVVVPTPLVAATVKVYGVPLVNPVMVHEVPAVVHDFPLGEATTL